MCRDIEVEQAAYNPAHMVPGIEPSADPVLQSVRLQPKHLPHIALDERLMRAIYIVSTASLLLPGRPPTPNRRQLPAVARQCTCLPDEVG